MANALSEIKPKKGSTHKKIRHGRGIPSGHGKTSGRGHRGQKCRSGYSATPHKEGGQTPLYRRLPKHQTNERPNRKVYSVINLSDLQKLADSGINEIDVISLIENGVIKSIAKHGLKVLASGVIKSKVNVLASKFSATAKEAIEAAGGTATITSED